MKPQVDEPVLPRVIHHGPDLLQRTKAWQIAHSPPDVNGVLIPDDTYLLVRDLLGAILWPSLAHLPEAAPSSPSAGWQNTKTTNSEKE